MSVFRTGPRLLARALLVLAMACGDGGRTSPVVPVADPDVTVLPEDDPLRTTPEAVVIDGRTVVQDGDIERDLLSQGPLSALVRVRAVDGSPFPRGVEIDRLWVIHGSLVWRSSPGSVDDGEPSVITGFSTGGPQWGPEVLGQEVYLTTVVRLRRGEETWLLRASDQRLHVTV